MQTTTSRKGAQITCVLIWASSLASFKGIFLKKCQNLWENSMPHHGHKPFGTYIAPTQNARKHFSDPFFQQKIENGRTWTPPGLVTSLTPPPTPACWPQQPKTDERMLEMCWENIATNAHFFLASDVTISTPRCQSSRSCSGCKVILCCGCFFPGLAYLIISAPQAHPFWELLSMTMLVN